MPGPPHKHVFLPAMSAEPVEVAVAGPAALSCPGGEGLTILLDGEECADPAYRDSRGQPAAVVRLQEKSDSALILIDVGLDPAAFRQNLGVWAAGVPDGKLPARRAMVLSHAHTYAPLLMGGKKGHDPAAALTAAWEVLGNIPVSGPNLADICAHAGENIAGPAARLCGSLARSLEPGLRPVAYADGTKSNRAWLYTWAISPEERAEVPFQPLETLLIVSSGAGYLVYSICSHMAQETDGIQELHIVERVADLAASGKLPPGPVHTLITGLCGVIRTFEETGGKTASGAFDSQGFVRRLENLQKKTGLQRIYFSHCGLRMDPIYPLFQRVLGEENVRIALPGSCIPLP